jgi:hypothetical protein
MININMKEILKSLLLKSYIIINFLFKNLRKILKFYSIKLFFC